MIILENERAICLQSGSVRVGVCVLEKERERVRRRERERQGRVKLNEVNGARGGRFSKVLTDLPFRST